MALGSPAVEDSATGRGAVLLSMATRRRAKPGKPHPTRATRPRPTAEVARQRKLEQTVRALERRLAKALAALAALRAAQERKIAAVQRAADRRLAAMVRELVALRHHEAGAAGVERMVKERDATRTVERRDDGEASGTAG